ncbi:MAG TPA: hypothetical protein VHB21_05950, partial [Minicystis sp.]|nr:hypothetical protein [Minicystis sp.]
MQTDQTEIGIVCGQCDTWSPMGTARCPECQHDLALFMPPRASMPPASTATPSVAPKQTTQRPSALAMMAMRQAPKVSVAPPAPDSPAVAEAKAPMRTAPAPGPSSSKGAFADLSQEELMEQARNYVCRSCSSGVPSGHKFCGR